MYYQPEFLQQKWAEYKKLKGLSSDEMVNPDDFIAWGFEELVHHRIPLYETIAKNYGYAIEMDEIPALQNETDFLSLISRILDKR